MAIAESSREQLLIDFEPLIGRVSLLRQDSQKPNPEEFTVYGRLGGSWDET